MIPFPLTGSLTGSLSSCSYFTAENRSLYFSGESRDLWYGASELDVLEFGIYNLETKRVVKLVNFTSGEKI
jgi:hypothetical protein